MTQQNAKNIQEDQGFIAADQNTDGAPADLSVCSTGELTFEAGDIEDIKLENDTLIITLKDGSEVTIEDFNSVMAATGVSELTLADGTVIDLSSYKVATTTEEGEGEAEGTQPASNENEPEETAEAVNAPTEETLETVIAEGTQDEDAIIEQITQVEPAAGEEAPQQEENMAQLAQQLAEVEPAAGDAGTPGASGRGGFGFDSSTDPITSAALNAIGPINPTALQYGINNQNDEQLFLEDPLTPPLLSVNNGIDDAIVKEDGSIFVPIVATLQGADIALQVLTVTISGVDAATAATGGFLPTAVPGVYALTLPAGTDYNGGITVTPDAQSDVDLGQFSVIATASKPSTGEIESVSDDATVITDAVADKPVVDGDDASTFVNNALDVDVTGSLGADNFDGSETITHYTITSTTDLSGFTFSAGVYDIVTNTLTIDPADLAGLQVTPPADFIGSIDLEVTIYNEETNLSDNEPDTSDNTNSASDVFTLTWVKGPTIEYKFSAQVDGDTGLVKEDGTLEMALDVDAGDPAGPVAGDEILTVTISGIDPTWTVNLPGQSGAVWTPTGTPGEFSITLPAGEDYSGILSFTPPAQSDVDHPQITISASVFDPVLADSAGDSDNIDIVTDAVADEPTVDGDDASTFVDQPLNVDVMGGLGADADGSETITHYTITSTTDLSGFTFSAGVYDIVTNTLTIDPADLAGLQVTPPAGFVGSIDLDVTIYNEETNLSDTEVDLSDNTNSASDTFTLTWVDGPVIKYEFSNEVDGDTGLVKEDSSVTLNLSVDNVDPVGPVAGDEVLTITISDLDPTWTVNLPGQSGAVWTPTGTPGEFSITLPAGESYTGAITFTPPADSDLDHPTFTITADVNDPVLALTESDSATADILTDAVIDTPTLEVLDASGEEGTTIPLNITAAIGETASYVSETITEITLSGLPAGATLNNGTYDPITDTWTLTLADLSGLEVTIPDGVTGVFSLIVKVTSEEDVAAGDAGNGEVDFSDNIATVEKRLELSVEKDTVPTVRPAPISVDEEDLSPLSQTGDLNVDFGDDVEGAQICTNSTVPTGLTSAGQTVTVTSTDTVYTGTNEDGDTVFTLTLNSDGTYTYEQILPLDHAEGTGTDDTLPLVFGVTVKDGDGDEVSGTVTVNVQDDEPVANDDVNLFDSNAGTTSGNVITGDNGALDTSDTDVDDQSNDTPNTVVEVNGQPVAETGTTIINGTYGVLEIDAQGNYTYTLNEGVEPSSGCECESCAYLNPTAADVEGDQTSITLNGITISIGEPRPGSTISSGGDLKWRTEDGGGIGIGDNGSSDTKVWPRGEVLNVDPAQDASSLEITLGDIGSNNVDHPLSVDVHYTDGSSETLTFNVPNPAPVDFLWTFTVDGGAKQIDSVDLYNEPGDDSVSFVLNNVKACFPVETKLIDEFEYTLKDYDGDTDTATLTVCAEDLIDVDPIVETSDVTVDETNLDAGNLVQSGTVTADFGVDGPGTITTNGVAPVGLTSGGLLVTVTSTANGYEGATTAGTVFTLTLNGDGTYTYTQILPLDHPNTADHDDAIELEFGVVATDEDCDETPATIKVTVKDDGPVANDDLNRFDSNDGSTSGNVIAGVNGPNDTTDADIDEPSEDVDNTVTAVNGVPVSETGTTEIAGTYGKLTIDAQGNYTYELYSPGGLPTPAPYEFSNTETFPVLQEGQPVTDPDVLGVHPDDLDVDFDATGSVQFVSEGAGYNNTFGQFYIADDGSIVSADIIIQNGNDVAGSEAVTNFDINGAGSQGIGFFIIADGFDTNNSYGDIDLNNGTLNFFYKFGTADERPANVSDDGGDVSLVFTATGGEQTVLEGPIYFTTERGGSDNLNADSSIRVVSGLADPADPTTLRIGFEDLPNLGDEDYNDIVFDVTITPKGADKLVDEFEYTLTDGDGDTDTAILTICAEDLIDVEPDLETSDVVVDETNFDAGNLVQSGTVTADFGVDGPGTITTNGVAPAGLTAGGQAVSVTNTDTGYTGTNEDGDTVFTLVLNADGTYTYTQILPLDHPNTADHDDAIDLVFGVVAEDIDHDTVSGLITVTVKDDGPSAGGRSGRVFEKDLRDGGEIVVMRTIKDLDFGEDGPGYVAPSRFVAKFQVGGPDVTLQSAGVDIDVTIEGNGFVGKAGDTTVFTLEIDPTTGKHTYTQYEAIDHPDGTNPDDVIWLKFFMKVYDNDGDSVEVMSMFDVHDDAPIANDDVNDSDSTTATGNVITGVNGGPDADDVLSADDDNTITEVDGIPVSETGTTDIPGTYGTLSIDAQGNYTYTPTVLPKSETVYCFSQTNPPGGDAAGNIDQVDMEYNSTTNMFTFTMKVDESADGFTVAVNGGANPKGISSELALIYFDATGTEPVITAYSYNGHNTHTSYIDGSPAAGNQPADKIASSLNNPELFSNISVTTDGAGNKIMTFTVDAASINAHDPLYGDGSDWEGLQFGHQAGIWLHPASGLSTEYGADGYLTNWDAAAKSYYDASYQDVTTKHICPEPIEEEFIYTLTDEDGDSDTATLSITIDLDNDNYPVVTSNYDVVDETYLSIVKEGSINIDYGIDAGDGNGVVTNNTFQAAGSLAGGELTHKGEKIEVKLYGKYYVGTTVTTGIQVFVMKINSDGTYKYEQFETLDHADGSNPNDIIKLKFGISVTDHDCDTTNAFVTIKVKDDAPIANDDVNTLDMETGLTSGNVISGVNGGPDAEDNLSNDEPNTVYSVDGTVLPTNGSDAIIVGQYGVLKINNAGEYTYEAEPQSIDTTIFCLDPHSCDVSGIQDTLSNGGVTVSVKNAGYFDITWVTTADGSGLGINNLSTNDSTKVWPKGETFDISFDEDVSEVTLTISEIGDNNDDGDHGVDYKIYFADGSTYVGEQQFVPGEIVDGTIDFTLKSSDFGGKQISSIDLNSTNEGQYVGASFLLNNVKAIVCDPVSILEKFEYVLQDSDGDTSTATLVISGDVGNPNIEIINNGGGEDIYGDNSAKDIFLFTGNAGNDNDITDFDVSEDVLDFSAMIEGYDSDSHAIADFISMTESGTDTIVSVDTNGSIGGANFENVVTLHNVTGLDVEDLVTDGTLVA